MAATPNLFDCEGNPPKSPRSWLGSLERLSSLLGVSVWLTPRGAGLASASIGAAKPTNCTFVYNCALQYNPESVITAERNVKRAR